MKRTHLLLLVVLALLVSLSCSAIGGGSSGGKDDDGGGDVVTTGGEIDITIVNRSPDEVCYVLISPSDDESWGDDLLGSDETIQPGASRVFSFDDGMYDVRAEDCDEAAMATAWEVTRSTSVTVGDPGAKVRLLVENASSSEVCYVFISSSNAEDWGDDWMGEMETLQPEMARMFYVKSGEYDLQVADCDGETLTEEYEVDLTEDLTWTLND